MSTKPRRDGRATSIASHPLTSPRPFYVAVVAPVTQSGQQNEGADLVYADGSTLARGGRIFTDPVRVVSATDLRLARKRIAEDRDACAELGLRRRVTLLDIVVTVDGDIAGACRRMNDECAADDDGALSYVGTAPGLASLVFDIAQLDLADGVLLRPRWGWTEPAYGDSCQALRRRGYVVLTMTASPAKRSIT